MLHLRGKLAACNFPTRGETWRELPRAVPASGSESWQVHVGVDKEWRRGGAGYAGLRAMVDELSGMEGGPWRGGFHGARREKTKKKERKKSKELCERKGAAEVGDICMKLSSVGSRRRRCDGCNYVN